MGLDEPLSLITRELGHHLPTPWYTTAVVATRVLALCLLTACYSTPQPDCGFVCGPTGDCPDGYQCASDNRCHREGTPASLICAVDAPPRPDAPPRDVIIFDADGPDGAIDAATTPDADVTAPVVMSTTPTNGATGVSRTTTIIVQFSENVVGVNGSSFAVTIGANPVAGSLVALTSDTWQFTPNNMLMNNATVTVSLSASITDASGNALVPVMFSFSTGN